MAAYLRPAIDAAVFRDEGGQVIDYGKRWSGSPPEDTYSVDTHPERFAPLHTVAAALIEHLRDSYEVAVDEGIDTASDLMHPAYHDVLRAVRLRPDDPTCAALTLVFTAYPGIYMHAGLLNDFHYPVCGCDACDSTWQGEADDLEQQMLAVAAGNYREGIDHRDGRWVGHDFTFPGGGGRSGGYRAEAADARIDAAEPILRTVAGGWAAWPRAASGS